MAAPLGSHGLPVTKHDPDRASYLRIGPWHPREQSWNYAKGDIEAGVSAYDLDHHGNPVAPQEADYAEEDMHDRLKDAKLPKFLVHGDLQGEGHDGEPLLKNVRVHGLWKPDWRK